MLSKASDSLGAPKHAPVPTHTSALNQLEAFRRRLCPCLLRRHVFLRWQLEQLSYEPMGEPPDPPSSYVISFAREMATNCPLGGAFDF